MSDNFADDVARQVDIPQRTLPTGQRFDENLIVDYADKMTKNYTQSDIDQLTALTTHNADSQTALLGSFEPNSVTSYEQIAHANGWTYFDAGDEGWKAMSKVDSNLAYKVNDQFLIDQIDKGKDFILTKSPEEAQKAFIESGGKKFVSYNTELTMLNNNGYKIENMDNFGGRINENRLSPYQR